MNSTDPKFIALQFNEYINQQNLRGLTGLMMEDHRFIDRAGTVVIGKDSMTKAWVRFFELFPEYCNTFDRVASHRNLVILYGYATWKKGEEPDHALWTATIQDDLVAEWRIYEDTKDNWEKLALRR